MKLFMIHVGGHTKGSTIEVHDCMFIVSNTFEGTIEEVKKRWYGTPEGLHIDSYKVINFVDNYRLVLGLKNDKKLYMVNYGGFHPEFTQEVHKNAFFVTDKNPKTIANRMMSQFEYMDHIDAITDVEEEAGISIGFLKGEYTYISEVDWKGYKKIGV